MVMYINYRTGKERFFFFLRQSLTPSPGARLECSGATLVYCNFCLPCLSDSPTSASQVAETTGMHCHVQLAFVFLVEGGLCDIDQAGLELLTLGDPPTKTSQGAGITGVSHLAWPCVIFKRRSHYTAYSVTFFSSNISQTSCLSCIYACMCTYRHIHMFTFTYYWLQSIPSLRFVLIYVISVLFLAMHTASI